MAVSLQLGFTDYEQIYAKKKTRRQRFLDDMEATTAGALHERRPDEQVQAFLGRPLDHARFPYVDLDATYRHRGWAATCR